VQAQRQQGASLIEVLVALTLVAFTMLGLLGLQLRSMSSQKDSLDRRTAALLVSQLGERVSANFAGFEQQLYNGLVLNPPGAPANDTAPDAAACVTPDNCTTNEIATRDWALFAQQVRTRLPGGVAFVATPPDLSRATVVVGWIDTQRIDALNVGGAKVERDLFCPDSEEMKTDLRYRCYVASLYP
jgi:type IV pilus modification protein PilV